MNPTSQSRPSIIGMAQFANYIEQRWSEIHDKHEYAADTNPLRQRLSSRDEREILNLAIQELPPPSPWTNDSLEHRVALQATVLSIRNEAQSGHTSRMCVPIQRIVDLDWSMVPEDCIGLSTRLELADWMNQSAELAGAMRIYRDHIQRIQGNTASTPEDHQSLADIHDRIADISIRLGDFQEALNHLNEAINIKKQLVKILKTDESAIACARALDKAGEVEEALGDLHAAASRYWHALLLNESIDNRHRTASSARAVMSSLMRLAHTEEARGYYTEARSRYRECLEIARREDAKLKTPDSRQVVVILLKKMIAHAKRTANHEEERSLEKELITELAVTATSRMEGEAVPNRTAEVICPRPAQRLSTASPSTW